MEEMNNNAELNQDQTSKPIEEVVEDVVQTPEKEVDEAPKKVEEPVTPEAEDATDEKNDVEEPITEAEEIVEEQPKEELSTEELEKLRAELEEFKDRETETAIIQEVEKTSKQAKMAYDKICVDLRANLEAAFDHYKIDPTKTLEEIKKEDPAKGALAEKLINDAMRMKEAVYQKAQQDVREKYNEAVFNRAEKYFNKYALTEEQQQAAAEAFVDIMMEAGIKDLKGDLEQKVKLAVASAKFAIPDKVETVTEKEEKVDTETVVEEALKEEPLAIEEPPADKEEVEKDKTEETKEEKPAEEEAEKEEEKKEEPKIDIGEFMEGAPKVADAVNVLTVDNVLVELAKLPHRERGKFYKVNRALIEKALAKESAEKYR